MTKYKLEDLKVGAVFKNGNNVRTILMVGKTDVFFSLPDDIIYWESSAAIDSFLGGHYGELVRPTMKIAYVEFWNSRDLSSKRYCSKEVWNRGASTNSTLKFIREFEIEVGEDGFPIEGGV